MDKDAIVTPRRGQRLKINMFEPEKNDPREITWTLLLDDQALWTPEKMAQNPWEFRLHGHLVDAAFSLSVDQRLANQRDSIDRLVNHLRQHCPQLMGKGSCEHMPV